MSTRPFDRVVYAVEQVPKEEQRKARWTPVGVTFVNRDNSETLLLRPGVSVSGKLILRTPKERPEDTPPPSDDDFPT